jgi:hypothetical protein
MLFMEALLGRTVRGPGWADAHMNSRMSLASESSGMTAYVTRDWGARPEKIESLTEKGERYCIGHLIGEVNREMRLGLANAVIYGRTLSSVKPIREDLGPISVVTIRACNLGGRLRH